MRGHLVAVENDLRLRLVVLEVEQGKGTRLAGHQLALELLGEPEQFARVARGGDDELDVEIAAAGQRLRA